MNIIHDFEAHYKQGGWDGKGSGPGSTEAFTRGFRKALRSVFDHSRPAWFLDIACGDWQWQQHMDWTDVDYYGVEISETAAQSAYEKHQGRHKIEVRDFSTFPVTNNEGVFLVKDLLHHIPTEKAKELIEFTRQARYVVWVLDLEGDGRPHGWPSDVPLPSWEKFYDFDLSVEGYPFGPKAAFLQINCNEDDNQVA